MALVFSAFVFLGMIPSIAAFAQLLLVGFHRNRNHYSQCTDYTPRVAFLLPAWNEAEVIGAGIDSLMKLDYPVERWRIYVIDDASTDDTPLVLGQKMQQYPGTVFHLRREVGGQGKAHTLNHGLRTVLADDWAEAIMIMDADVLFEPLALRRMTRHLGDPTVGAVTAYIKEGSSPSSLVTRYITFEYITAQAAARRAQNFAGVMACLAGGAQLHSRANIEAIGGAIDTSSLAEDTFTTLKTQLSGKRVIFDANATVWAEEPASLTSLWKQRLRWARGNLQITLSFRKLWFNPKRHSKLGSVPFGILWFSIVFLPLFMVFASLGLIGMYEFYPGLAWNAFGMFWGSTVGVYLFETLYSFAIDPVTARRAWLEGLIFPGIISLGVMTVFFVPPHLVQFLQHPVSAGLRSWESNVLALLIYSWAALSMLAAWAVYRLERAGAPGWLCSILLVAVGYGPQLCAISLAALIAHCRKAESRWDKTVKSGRVKMLQ